MRSTCILALIIALGAAAALAESSPARGEEAREMVAMNPQTLKFTSIPDMPTCASAAIVRGNPRNGPAWVFLKLASGCRVPWHWHTPNEDMLVISGQGTIETKDGKPLRFTPGAYTSLPSHHVHRASCSRACMLFSIADGAFDIHYVDANGEEIRASKALATPVKIKRTKK